MLELRGRLDLGEKTLGPKCSCEVGMQDFYRNITLMPQVVREEDCRHPANANLTGDAVPGIQRGGYPRKHVAHRSAKYGIDVQVETEISGIEGLAWAMRP
jgi:hypothetical protein